jgi:seryl-tRNA synthetase
MLDIELIRQHPGLVKKAIADKHEKADINQIIKLDEARRALITQTEALRSKRNQVSDEIANLKKAKQDATELIASMKQVGEEIKLSEEKLRAIEPELANLVSWVPNIPAKDVPVGDEKSNQIVKEWTNGSRKQFDFTPLPHWELGKNLNIIDFAASAKISGAGFILLKGLGAKLERALINFMLDLHTTKHGYTEIMPPFLVNRATMFATGQIPKLEADMYHVPSEDLFLIPTAEVPLTNIHRDNTLTHNELPRYYVAYSACFRKESGSYGKETRGITRVHQFNKVEMLKFVHPDTSFDELEKMLQNAEAVLQALGLEYRIVLLSTGDMSFASAKTYDIEIWAPGMGQYLEVSSCSNFTDFQARRGNIRFKDKDNKTKFVHTLNGSGLALPRTLIALLETYQQKDGSIEIPAVLKPYIK